MEPHRDHEPKRGARNFVIAILIVTVVIAMVILHLTGVVGPGSH